MNKKKKRMQLRQQSHERQPERVRKKNLSCMLAPL